MQNTSTPLLFGICSLATICSGLLFVMLLVILRVTGRNFMTFFSMLIRNAGRDEELEGPINLPRRRVNLRAKAEALDFNDALAAQAADLEPDYNVPKAQSKLPPSSFDRPSDIQPPGFEPVSRPRRRRRDEPMDDMLLGGIMDDEDGDLG
jgi:hypothetical protein